VTRNGTSAQVPGGSLNWVPALALLLTHLLGALATNAKIWPIVLKKSVLLGAWGSDSVVAAEGSAMMGERTVAQEALFY